MCFCRVRKGLILQFQSLTWLPRYIRVIVKIVYHKLHDQVLHNIEDGILYWGRRFNMTKAISTSMNGDSQFAPTLFHYFSRPRQCLPALPNQMILAARGSRWNPGPL